MDFERWYGRNRADIPKIFAESVSLINVHGDSVPSMEKEAPAKFRGRSTLVADKMRRLKTEYDRAYKELIQAESSMMNSPSAEGNERRNSILHSAESDVGCKSAPFSLATLHPPTEAVFSSHGKKLSGFDWGTAQTNDVLQPSLIQSYWNSTGRADNSWLDFVSWASDFAN